MFESRRSIPMDRAIGPEVGSSNSDEARRARRGWVNGAVGVAIFSVTLPATRIAVTAIDPSVVGLGRAVVAGLCAIVYLAATRAAWPRGQWRRLGLVAACVVFGFPLLTSFAMQRLPAAHGAIVIGLLPLSTAIFAVVFAHERPSRAFWLSAALGSGIVVAYAVIEGGGTMHTADLLLLGAVVCAGIGYAEGGRLSKSLGGPQVIAWSLVLSLPVLVPATAWLVAAAPPRTVPLTAEAIAAFAYLSVGSMFVGFFFWYRGLAIGGVARVGQLQLLQPFLSVAVAALLLHEAVGLRTLLFASAVVACVAAGRRFAIGSPANDR